MSRRAPRRPRHRRATSVVLVVVAAVVAALLAVVVDPTSALAAGTVLFNNTFNDRTVDGTGTVTVPTPTSGTNAACLTANGNSATLPLLSCAGNIDSQGSGVLRLTSVAGNQIGGVFGQTSYPTSSGLDVTFDSYQWGGGSADGLAFLLAAVDPANPAAPTRIGPGGGSLGYSPAGSIAGLPNAYLGLGLDVYGNFSSTSFQGTGCTNVANITAPTPDAVVARGPGNGSVGYCGLSTTSDGTAGSRLNLRAATRTAVPVEVLVNPTSASFTAASGVTVAGGTYKIVVSAIGQSAKTLSGPLPSVAAGLYPSASWVNTNGVPKQLAFGFVGSSGSITDNHEISNTKVVTFDPVPQLAVSTSSYSVAAPVAGAPVNYQVTASVLAGANETAPVSVTQTVPAGVVPVGAYGTGWVCQTPVGLGVTCTTSSSSFANGTTLPVLNVVATVTGSSVTSTLVQSNSTTRASSTDADPATDTTAAGATVAAVPTGVSISPASGPIAGGALTLVSATTHSVAATAIEIGTTAEQQAGTSVVLLPCASGFAAGCFSVSAGVLVITSMPSRAAAATVGVSVVTLGSAGTTNYVYGDRPSTPAAPTATAGITSATITWVAPTNNGGVITGYILTPYLAGVAQTAQSFDASTTVRTLTGLTAGGAYTFAIAATNAYGTSAASVQSAVVMPYTLPGAPTIAAVTAGTSAATLTWNAPSSGGSPITGYLITPYIGTVAQTARSITGTATTQTVTGLNAGTAYTFSVAAQNLAGTGPASAHSSTVTPNISPSLTFTAPPAGEVGVAYSRQLSVANGTAPFVWSVSNGTLPDGLTLNASTGLLSGTPTTGTSTFTVQVVDGSNQSATKVVTLVVAAAPTLTFSPSVGEVSLPYSQQPTITGGTGPFGWSITAGTLPTGLALNPSTGLVSGTPTTAVSAAVTITATDAFNQNVNTTVTLDVVALPVLGTASPPAAQVGVAYATNLGVSGGSRPLTWSITTGTLPAGLTLNRNTGAVTGTPTTAGNSPVTISVTDANNQATSRTLTFVVGAGPLVIVKTADVSSAAPGTVVAYTITMTNTGSTTFSNVALTDPLTGVLDDAAYGMNATASSGTLSYNAPTLGWTGTLAAGATLTISYSMTVTSPDPGDKVLSNTVTSSTLGTNCASGSVDARCSSTVTVPGVTIVSTASTSTTTPGSIVGFRVVVTNTGQSTYTSATLTDRLAGTLDDATYDADAATTSGNVSYGGSALTWTGVLAVGASATITYTVTVTDPDTGDRSLTAAVTSPSAGSSCPSTGPAPQCTATVTVLVPALSITNTPNVTTSTPGSTVTYTILVANVGQTAYPAASFTDDLSTVLTDASYTDAATATSGTVAYTAPSLTWTGALAPGASATISYSVRILDPDPGDKTLVDTVVSATAGNNCPAGSTDLRCTATVTVLVPGITIATSANTATTVPGANIQYTVTVTNSGATAFTGATVADSLAGVFDDATYNADAVASTGTLSLTGSTLSWSGNLPVGAVARITYSVTVHIADGGDNQITNTVTSTTTGNNCTTASPDPRCTDTVPVARLVLSQSYPQPTTTPGSVLRLTATFTNAGQVPYTGITVTSPSTDTVDDARPGGDQTASSGTLTLGPAAIMWTGNIAVGASVTVTGTITVNDPDAGNKLITGTLMSTAPGSNCPVGGTDSRCTALASVLVPQLTITTTADTTTTVPGGSVGYTITMQNTGQTPYTAAVVTDSLVGVLDNATYGADATASIGAVSFTSPTLTWTGDLDVGQSAIITYSVTVATTPTGDVSLFNAVSSRAVGNTCPAASGNPGCSTTVNIAIPSLTIQKTADHANATLGVSVTYTVTVTDTGPTSYPAAMFTDSLAGVLDDAAYKPAATTATGGTVGYQAGVLSWTGALTPDQSVTISYTVMINNPHSGDRSMLNTVISTSAGSNCAAANNDSRCTATVAVTDAVSLTFTNVADVTSSAAGATVRYTVVAANSSTQDLSSVDFTDPLGGILDDAIYNEDATASAGVLAYTSPNLTWTGTVPALGTITVTYSVTVHSTGTGNQILTGDTISSSTLPASNNCTAGSSDPRCTSTVPIAALSIRQTAAETTITPGAIVHLTATYTNTGQVPYTGISIASPRADTADDTIPTGDQIATSGTIVRTTDALTWTGDIPVGATVTVLRTLRVQSPDPGNKIITATVQSTAPGNNCGVGTTDAQCTFLVTVLIPELSTTVSANTTFVVPGASADYTVTVENTGTAAYTGATVIDTLTGILDDASYNGDALASSGTLSFTDQNLTWTGDLAVGATATITYTATAHQPATGDKTMVNLISSTDAGSTCPPAGADAACSNTVAVLTPALTINSSTSTPTAAPGDTVSYRLTVTNTGQTAYTPATLTAPLADVLDDATYGDDAAANTGTVTVAAELLTWTGVLAPGASATITYSLRVDDPVAGNFRLNQTVTSTDQGSTCPLAGTDPRCTTSIAVRGLQILNSADASTTQPMAVVENTVTFTNIGQVPYVDISISDNFAGSLDDATYNGDATATAGSLVLVTGTGRVTWTGDLAVGASVTVTGSLTVDDPDRGDRTMTTVVSTDTAASNCPSAAPAPACTSSVAVSIPELTISTTASSTQTEPGAVVGYTIVVTNTGHTDYAAATLTASLNGMFPDSAYNADATATGGTLTYLPPLLTWTGALAIGATVTITYSVTVRDPDPGDKLMTSTVTSSSDGSTCPIGGAAPSCATAVRVLVPALAIITSADTSSVVAAGTVHYTVTVTNTGETAYTSASFADSLTGLLDDASYPGDATASTGSLDYTSGTLTWTGALPVGASAIITYSVTTLFPATGDHTLTNTVASISPDSNCGSGTGPGCTSTVTVLVPALLVTKTVDTDELVAGAHAHYTVTATNTGQADYPAATLTDSLAGLLDDAVYPGDAVATRGTLTYADSTLSWTGALPIGATVSITYSVAVNVVDTGNETLDNRVVSTSAGSTCPADSANRECVTSTAVSARSITLSGVAPSFTLTGLPGSTVRSNGAVTLTIATNSPGGYQITVQSTSTSLTGRPGNDDTIPINDLSVRPSGTGPFIPVSTDPQVISQHDTASSPNGDAVSNDYQIKVPFVAGGTYTTTLDYITSAQ